MDALILKSKYESKFNFPDLGCFNNSKKQMLQVTLIFQILDFPDLGCSNIKKQNASKDDFPGLGCSNVKDKYASEVDFRDLGSSNIVRSKEANMQVRLIFQILDAWML